MEYYSVIKNNEIMLFAATWMELEIIKLSKSEIKRQISCDITHIWNLKSNINLFTNQQQTQQTQKTSLPLPKRKGKEG